VAVSGSGGASPEIFALFCEFVITATGAAERKGIADLERTLQSPFHRPILGG
jgi:hypothetical protein